MWFSINGFIALMEDNPEVQYAKMLGLIQSSDYPVEIIHQSRIKAKLKDVELDISNIEDDQVEAMKVA